MYIITLSNLNIEVFFFLCKCDEMGEHLDIKLAPEYRV